MQLVSHELSGTVEKISSLDFSCVDGSNIVMWDSSILLLLLACRRFRPTVTFRGFPDKVLALSGLYGARDIIFGVDDCLSRDIAP
ncbi:hypothetical protein [Candidatus Ichthyocystis sparus]|nr:hypothetical protein [Candidatus Ichthyocystis sparus]